MLALEHIVIDLSVRIAGGSEALEGIWTGSGIRWIKDGDAELEDQGGDDWKKVIQRSSDGLAGRWKMLGQFGIAGGVLTWGYVTGVLEPDLAIPFLKDATLHFDELIPGAAWMGWAYVVFGMFVCNGSSNAVNLTDGLDGLAIGPVMTSAMTLGILSYLAGHAGFSEYLSIPYVEGSGELTVFAVTIVGAGLGFL